MINYIYTCKVCTLLHRYTVYINRQTRRCTKHMHRFHLFVLLTFKIQPHKNTQTNLYSLHTFKTNIYKHSDKKNHALQTGIHTSLHTIK